MTLTKPTKQVAEIGEYDKGEGARVLIHDGHMLFLANVDGSEMTVGVTLEHVLEMIGEYNRETGS